MSSVCVCLCVRLNTGFAVFVCIAVCVNTRFAVFVCKHSLRSRASLVMCVFGYLRTGKKFYPTKQELFALIQKKKAVVASLIF